MSNSAGRHRNLASLLAIIAAIASFFVHSGVLGLILAVAAIIFGAMGFLLSFLPGVRGGCISVVAMLLGLLGGLAGIVRAGIHIANHG